MVYREMDTEMVTKEQVEECIMTDSPVEVVDNEWVLLENYGLCRLEYAYLTKRYATIELVRVLLDTMMKNIKTLEHGSVIARNMREAFDQLYVELYDKESSV
jgi:hypothetical protein